MASMALTLAGSSLSFQAPAAFHARRAAPQMVSIQDLPGATEEVGGKVWDPLGLSDMCPYGSMEFEWMRTAEIKHGRVCMAAFVGWLVSELGITFPGNLATDLKFADVGVGLSAWENVPMLGKAQIFLVAGLIETANECKKPHYLNAGMIKFEGPRAKSRIAELKNGRAAMIGVAGFYAASVIPGSVPLVPSTWQ